MISAKVIWTDNERYLGKPHPAMPRHGYGHREDGELAHGACLIALCGCTASDVVGILHKKREPFTGLEVTAHGERASEYPRCTRRSGEISRRRQSFA